MNKKRLASLVATALIGGGMCVIPTAAQAQPPGAPPPPAAKVGPGQKPPHRPRMTKEQRQQKREQRKKQMEQRMRDMMAQNGVTDADTQTTVLNYLQTQMKGREPLRKMGIKLEEALSNKNLSDDQIKALTADYQNAQKVAQQNREKSQADLDAKIHFSTNPRLKGLLVLMGVVGNGPPLMRGPRKHHPKHGERGKHGERRKQLMQKFDANHDGKLDNQEKAAMRAYIKQHRDNKPATTDKTGAMPAN